MTPPEDPLVQCERHVREGEERIARQVALLEAMQRDNHPHAADQARKVLATLQWSLDLAREHLRMEREGRGLEP